jgi:hypothetical protein
VENTAHGTMRRVRKDPASTLDHASNYQ